jgi:hypothetical protein
MNSGSFLRGFILTLLPVLLWVDDAQAYIDPGTGGLLIQSLIAAFVGGFFLIKGYLNKLKTIFNKITKILKMKKE